MAPPTHRERLWPGPLGWTFVLGFAVAMFIVMLPVHPVAAIVAAAAGMLTGVVAAAAVSPVVAVTEGELRAGPAHIPVTLLGNETRLDREGIRRALGPGSDARLFACLRAWIPHAVLLEVTDPKDPTPSWLVSTRHPDALLAAVSAQRTQAAHSEQII